jgi:phage shock protein PspC (stress-responsive transcriptional regulator)
MVSPGGAERMDTMSSVWSIRRSTADKKLAGVCGGVARHWNVDPILVRIGWALLALSGGVGIVLYVAAWLLVPADGAATSTMDDLTKGQTSTWPREAWVAIVAVACLVTFFAFSSASSFSFGPAVVLALIWYFGYYKSRARRPASSTQAPPPDATQQGTLGAPPAEPFRYPGPATPFTEAAEAWRQRVEDMRRGDAAASPSTSPSPVSPAPAAPREPVFRPTPASAAAAWETYPYDSGPSAVQDPVSTEVTARADFLATPDPVGLYTEAAPVKAAAAPSRRTQAKSLSARRLRLTAVVVLGLVLLGLAIADSLGAPITPVIYAAAALLVIGLTLVAATWLGRARGILPVGLLLLLVVLGLSVAPPASRFLHEFSYTSTTQFPATPVTVDRGVVKVDLRNVDVTADATFAADLGSGAIHIEVPPNTNVVLDYSVGNGVVMDKDATVASGGNLHGTAPLQQSRDNEATLTLDVDVDRGMVAVKR